MTRAETPYESLVSPLSDLCGDMISIKNDTCISMMKRGDPKLHCWIRSMKEGEDGQLPTTSS